MLLYCFAKRLFDVVASSLALLATAPLWVVVLLGIKLSSKGPVFYATERAGEGKRPFKLKKFRSMHVFHPVREGQVNEGGFIANAGRIFPFGSFLRKSKLDELPQLLNVLAGQMSVIGPRPLTVAGAEKHYSGKYRIVLDAKPGLAGLDSLFDYAHGELFVSSNEEYRSKVLPVRNELAKMYVERRGVLLDAYCIFRTLLLMFRIAVLRQRSFPLTRYEREATEAVFGPQAAPRKA